LSVVEIVALVAVLALSLLAVAATARSIAENLAVLKADLQEVDRHIGAIEPAAAEINRPLDEIVEALPLIADKAEAIAWR
ncbi:MAG: hypothetical protein M3481_11815, partial [Actinomycetota bacterium]|nr:hypothetical protein [Actinomycetota bacterium]